jgi:hypothetical protein
MKVKEKNSNRRCEVHLYSLGSTKPLDEFGEYVDPNDGAVCCFVPVEERQKIKIGGKLRGTTTTIQCDVLVDGICRKAVMYSGKAMTVEKVKKISVEKFLFSSTDGVIESNLVLKPIDEAVLIQENATITLGTIELRVYVLRHLEDKHALRDVPTYYEREGDGHDANEPVGFKSIKPDFTMTHEENRPILDNRKAKAEQRKMKSARPGNEAWAVFRFHYRDGGKCPCSIVNTICLFTSQTRLTNSCWTVRLTAILPMQILPLTN